MPIYDFENLLRAWAKSAFGLFVGFTVFYAFNSAFLGVLATAFFFFIPISNPHNERIVNASIFGGAMLVILFWAFGFVGVGLGLDLGISTGLLGTPLSLGPILFLVFIGLGVLAAVYRRADFAFGALGALVVAFVVLQPWSWSTSAIIFVAIWLIGFGAGVGGDVTTRPGVGVFALFVCFIIFTAGVGTQDVGIAFFGDWWPTIYNQFTTMTGPIGTAFGQLSKTFGDAWMLTTDPVGYASRLMTGTPVNPIGDAGSYGADLTNFEVTPILIDQPFQITTNVKNKGYSIAQNLSMTLSFGVNSVYSSGSITDKLSAQEAQLGVLGIDTLQCSNPDVTNKCIIYGPGQDTKKPDQAFNMLDIWQPYFVSNSGINCDASNRYQLRKKSIPMNITLTYRYSTVASLGKGTDKLQFISGAEWDRLARLDKLDQKSVGSEYTSGPVKLILGVVGLKVPIREDMDFNIGFNLLSGQKGGKIDILDLVTLNYPADFVLVGGDSACTASCSTGTPGVVECKPKGGGDKYFYCRFRLKAGAMGGSPTKSYIATAEAKYTYTVSQEKLMKVDFGSWCCQDSDCGNGYKCQIVPPETKGVCVPGTYAPGSTTTTCQQPTQSEITQYIQTANRNTQVEEAMIKAIIMAESSFRQCDPNGAFRISKKDCLGLMQVSKDAVTDVKDPASSPYQFTGANRETAEGNILAGAAYFKILQTRYKCPTNDLNRILTAYNEGPSACTTGSGTSTYATNVMDYYNCYSNSQYGLSTWYGPINKAGCTQALYPYP